MSLHMLQTSILAPCLFSEITQGTGVWDTSPVLIFLPDVYEKKITDKKVFLSSSAKKNHHAVQTLMVLAPSAKHMSESSCLLQNRNRVTDVENKFMATRGRQRGEG